MIKIRDNIYWLGLRDWELETFHGHEMSTPLGSSYNSYLVKDEKTALIDTCKATKSKEYLSILEKDVGFENIDLIVANHSEPDHGGMLGEILDRTGWDTPVYCTEMGKKFINRMFGEGVNTRVVKTGDEISLGATTLRFVEMRMIHWPDSMMTYVPQSRVLFSNDAFGQHIAAGNIFDDDADECHLFYEALKYFVNILAPLCRIIKKKLEEIGQMRLDIEYIAPSHGLVWHRHADRIIELYKKWADSEKNGKVLVIYDTMYGAAAELAKIIGLGLEAEGVDYRVYNVSTYDTSDLVTEMFQASGVIIGGPTINNSILSKTAGLLEEMRAMKFAGKLGASFGTYGWSGESCKLIKEGLEKAGIEVPLVPVSVFLKPKDEDRQKCFEYGRAFAQELKKKGAGNVSTNN